MFLEGLRHSFDVHADRTALELPGCSYRFSDLEHQAQRVAALLQSQGVDTGDRVLLFLRAKHPFLLAHLGALWAGAVPVPLNPTFKPAELRYFARDSQAAAIVCDQTTAAAADSIRPNCPHLRLLLTAEQVQAEAPARPYRHLDPQPDWPAMILYSSGTTGEPKGVVHTQSNLAAAVQAIARCWRFAPDDVLVNVLPLFHIHGLSFATHVSLLSGSRMVVGDRFHPLRTLDLVGRATVFMGVPPYYYAWLNRPECRQRAGGWPRLRLVTCGSAPIRADVLPQLESLLGRPIINRYGMTECHVLTSLPLDGPWPHGSVGLPLDGVEVTVRDEGGRSCPPDRVGAVWARGPNLFDQYWQRPEATRQAFDRHGWFDTGDLGRLNRSGFLTLVGRSKDLIIVGGFNVYPAVVERVLAECPGVRECAVVGMPDAKRGERVAAFVVPDGPGLQARSIRSFCRQRLADYQCPTRIELVDQLPRNAMGKVLKRQLRDRL